MLLLATTPLSSTTPAAHVGAVPNAAQSTIKKISQRAASGCVNDIFALRSGIRGNLEFKKH